MTAVSAAAAGLLAGCQGAGAPQGGGTVPASTAAGGTASASAVLATASATSSASAAAAGSAAAKGASGFIAIREPFDPGHPARPVKGPASCGDQNTTLAIEKCFEDKTETADAAIDTLRLAAFNQAPAGPRRALINAEDQAWLSARGTVCAKAYHSGGTIDGINSAGCLLDESTARLHALRGDKVPEAVLKSTDSTSPADLSWYTTPAGSRIGMSDTQGDATGGVIIAWTVIAGWQGYTVNPADFAYRDGSFADPGKVQGTSPKGHRVASGTEYTFSIDYSDLKADPHHGSGGWVYSPGAPAAIWR